MLWATIIRAARIRNAAHGGQILMSDTAAVVAGGCRRRVLASGWWISVRTA